jgi:uncharacterized Zn-binding protein involved in type VI secretion
MAQPLVMGDKIQGQCVGATHQIPNPASGAPQPSPAPLPFSSPLTMGLEQTVTIGGKAVAVVGSNGLNTPPHIGLHISDPTQANPMMQKGEVTVGSPTVTAGGKAVATTSSTCIICTGGSGTPVGTVADVTVG